MHFLWASDFVDSLTKSKENQPRSYKPYSFLTVSDPIDSYDLQLKYHGLEQTLIHGIWFGRFGRYLQTLAYILN